MLDYGTNKPNSKENKLAIPSGCHGHDLQELMYVFANWYALANERRDDAANELSQQELYIELVDSKALLVIDAEIIRNEEGRVSVDMKKARALMVEVDIDGNKTTPYKERCNLLIKQHALNRITSKVKSIEKLIGACQSGLSFDRQEIGMQK